MDKKEKQLLTSKREDDGRQIITETDIKKPQNGQERLEDYLFCFHCVRILFGHRLCRKRSKLVLLLRFIPQVGFVHFVRILSAPLSRQKAPPTDSLLFVSFIAFFLLLPANFIRSPFVSCSGWEPLSSMFISSKYYSDTAPQSRL